MAKKTEETLEPELEARVIRAIQGKDVKAMKQLLVEGFALEAPLMAADKKTALMLAQDERGDDAREIVLLLLKAGAEFKKTHIDLVWATYHHKEEVVPLLIARGADLNKKGSMGPPLLRAAAYNLQTSAKLLIAAGADINAGALHAAVENNHTAMARILVEAGAKSPPGQRMLAMAIEKENEEIALLLVSAEADVNERSDVGGSWVVRSEAKEFEYATPLMMAAAAGYKKLVEALLQAGADVHLADKHGATALDWANKNGHQEIAAILEKAAASQTRTVDPGVDLLYAAEKGETPRVKEFLAKGAKVDARDVRPGSKGFTPLMLAARGGNRETLDALLAAGAQVDANDETETSSSQGFAFVANEMGVEGAMEVGFQMRRTALHWAAEKHGDLIEILLRHGAAIEAEDRAKMTPLMIAAAAGNESAVAALLKAGANVNTRGSKKRDALLYAAESGNAAVARQLLAAGADPKTKNSDGETALIRAARRAQSEMVAALLEAGADARAVSRDRSNALAEVAGNRLRALKHVKGQGLKMVLLQPEEEMLKTARLLVDAGTDPLAKDKHDSSPMGLAKRGLKDHPFYAKLIEIFEQAKPQLQKQQRAPSPKKPKAKTEPPKKPDEAPTPAPDFSAAAKNKEFLEALTELETATGSKRQEMPDTPGAFTFGIHSTKAASFDFAMLQAKLLKAGCFIFYTGGEPIAAIPTRNPYDALLVMQTNGINDGLMPQDIIAWLQEIEKENPFVLTSVSHDSIDARFIGKVKKPATLAKRMCQICPDADEESEGLAEDLKNGRKLFLWWD